MCVKAKVINSEHFITMCDYIRLTPYLKTLQLFSFDFHISVILSFMCTIIYDVVTLKYNTHVFELFDFLFVRQ